MLRLCFERLPGYPSLDRRDEFIAWFDEQFPDIGYQYGGYIVENLGDMWFGQNVLWTVLMDNNMDVLTRIERQGWIVNGYAVHAYINDNGQNSVKINNDMFRISREQAMEMATA